MNYKLFSQICKLHKIPPCLKNHIYEKYIVRENMNQCVMEMNTNNKIIERTLKKIEGNDGHQKLFLWSYWLAIFKNQFFAKMNYLLVRLRVLTKIY